MKTKIRLHFNFLYPMQIMPTLYFVGRTRLQACWKKSDMKKRWGTAADIAKTLVDKRRLGPKEKEAKKRKVCRFFHVKRDCVP